MGPQEFRDGIFSEADPMTKYGTLQTSYSDGSLGQHSTDPAAQAARQTCRSRCQELATARKWKPRMRSRICGQACQRNAASTLRFVMPRWYKYVAPPRAMAPRPPAKSTHPMATSGLGAIRSQSSVGTCQQLCIDVHTQYGTPQQIKACNSMCGRSPRHLSARLRQKYKAGIQMGLPATRIGTARRAATAGLGQVSAELMTGAAIGLVLVGGLVLFGKSK